MKIRCAQPGCDKTIEVSFIVWLFACVFAWDRHPWLCEEDRFTEEEWDDLYDELKRTGKLS